MKNFKRLALLATIAFTNTFVSAQDNLRLEVVGNGVTTETLVQEGFESGFGSFTTSGDVTWAIQNSEYYAGSFAAKSGALSGNGLSNIETSVTIPSDKMGVLTFASKFEDSYYYSSYNLKVDGISVWNISGIDDWKENTIYLEPGTHTLTWTVDQYYYTGYYGGYYGYAVTAWLDNISVSYKDNHAVRIKDGNEGAGKIFTSDSQGNATWISANTILSSDDNIPLTLTGNTNYDYVLNINQNAPLGYGMSINDAYDGIRINNSSDDGLDVSSPGGTGVEVYNAGNDGIYSSNASDDGVYSYSSDDDGVYSYFSGDDGINSSYSGGVGVYSYNSGEEGILSSTATGDGISSVDAGGYGLNIANSGSYGINITDATGYGIRSNGSSSTSFVSTNGGFDGFWSNSASAYGYYNTNAGSYGFRSSSSGNYGIYITGATTYAGRFDGDVSVVGALSKSSGTFKIDHPVDPENKYLYHSFVESPDMMNIYNGNAVLDANGEATVEMPAYFETLNRTFRYQLTCIGGFANVYVADKMDGNQFKIAGGIAGIEVSWQVTGVRQDPYAEKNRVQVEVDKEEEFKGLYLHPEVYDLPANKGIDFNIEKRDNEKRAAKTEKLKLKEDKSAEKLQKTRAKAQEEEANIIAEQEKIATELAEEKERAEIKQK